MHIFHLDNNTLKSSSLLRTPENEGLKKVKENDTEPRCQFQDEGRRIIMGRVSSAFDVNAASVVWPPPLCEDRQIVIYCDETEGLAEADREGKKS